MVRETSKPERAGDSARIDPSRVARHAVAAAPVVRRARQDWLAEAMQCTRYENVSARSMG